MSKPLRLIARDEEDLMVLSAHLQDARLSAAEMAYLPKQRRFALLLDRYCWEDGEDAKTRDARMRAGLHFDGVLNARTQNVDQAASAPLVLLALGFQPGAEGAGAIEMFLEDGGRIRLDVECIDATMRDLDPPPGADAP